VAEHVLILPIGHYAASTDTPQISYTQCGGTRGRRFWMRYHSSRVHGGATLRARSSLVLASSPGPLSISQLLLLHAKPGRSREGLGTRLVLCNL
jgi:hypothetical protein